MFSRLGSLFTIFLLCLTSLGQPFFVHTTFAQSSQDGQGGKTSYEGFTRIQVETIEAETAEEESNETSGFIGESYSSQNGNQNNSQNDSQDDETTSELDGFEPVEVTEEVEISDEMIDSELIEVLNSLEEDLDIAQEETINNTTIHTTTTTEIAVETGPVIYSGDMNLAILEDVFAYASIVHGEESSTNENMQVYIPPGTTILNEDLKAYQGTFSAPTVVDLEGLVMQDIYSIIHLGSHDENLYFFKDGKPTEITVRVPIFGFQEGTPIMIFSSTDGNDWDYHGYGTVVAEGENAYIEFTTNHVTFFSLGGVNGNFVIDGDTPTTDDVDVQLQSIISGATEMKVGNSTGAMLAASWMPISGNMNWILEGADGLKTVYALFKNAGGETGMVSDDILLERIITAGRIENVPSDTWTRYAFEKEYSTTPVVIVTPSTDNNSNNYPIPQLRDITTTGFELKICVDKGATTCDTNSPTEDVDIIVVDQAKTAGVNWIDAGYKNTKTNGSNNNLFFNKTFANVPYMWLSSQTSNQGNNIATNTWVRSKTTSSAKIIGCTHQGTANKCTTGQPNETVGYLAIDSNNATIFNGRFGSSSMTNSNRTTANFPSGMTDPVMMATQNSDNGGQDPQYPWVRNISATSAQVRYCEQDGANDCDTHTTETIVWGAFDNSHSFSTGSQSGLGPGTGSISIGAPVECRTSGYEVGDVAYNVVHQCSGYFYISDQLGTNNDYYTTVQMNGLIGTYDTIQPADIQLRGEGLTLLSGAANSHINYGSGMTSFQPLTSPLVFIKKDPGGPTVTSTYGSEISIQTTIPAFAKADVYSGKIIFSIYEN